MTYQEIFEQDARWLSGPSIRTKIVNHLEGKSLAVERTPACASGLNFFVPLPLVQEELSGEEVSIEAQIPPELLNIFYSCLIAAISDYLGEEGQALLQSYLNSKLKSTRYALSQIQHDLLSLEMRKRAKGEGELRWVVAKHFGLNFNPTVQIIYG